MFLTVALRLDAQGFIVGLDHPGGVQLNRVLGDRERQVVGVVRLVGRFFGQKVTKSRVFFSLR